MKLNYKFIGGISLVLLMAVLTGCKKFIEIPPPRTQLTSSNVFVNDVGALAAQSSLYYQMINGNNYVLNLYPALSSDEIFNYSTDLSFQQLAQNSLTSANTNPKDIWITAYNFIYQANAVLE